MTTRASWYAENGGTLGPPVVPLGSIGLTQIHGGVGRAIRAGQWMLGDGFKDYEHAFVYVGGYRIIEAEPGGALRSSLGRYNPEKILWLRCPPEFGEAVAAAAVALIGTPYSFADYGAISAHRLHIPMPHLDHFIETSGHLICSQLADRAADKGGWHLFNDGRWVGDVSPGDITKLALAQELAA
jgi:hypothetical protein